MRVVVFLFLLFPVSLNAQNFSTQEIKNWKEQAKHVTIVRDNWGVPHIYGNTDADAAFGVMYAQCEDNYWQLEETYITTLGRLSELYGEKRLGEDGMVAVYQCRKKGKAVYANAPAFIKSLCNAAAAGINYYLQTHPNEETRLIERYEPWFFLTPTPIEPYSHGITRAEVQSIVPNAVIQNVSEGEQLDALDKGSNTIAISPIKSASGKSMLLINPHINFFGNGQRYECHLNSKQGLNVSGFAMFGSFWVWSGFNNYCGWAHTNSDADFSDVYLEKFNNPADTLLYKYGVGYRKAKLLSDTLLYKTDDGLKKKLIRFVTTNHGPVIAKRDSFYVTVKSVVGTMDRYIGQCWKMMKAKNVKEFTEALNIRAIDYPNTSYADRYGNIAYWHGSAIPKKNPTFDWRYPVDGSNPATEWMGVHTVNEAVHVINPKNGWVHNSNSTPYTSAGRFSPRREKYPAYMAYDFQTFRSDKALEQLSRPGKISYNEFEKMVVSTHLPMMEYWLPQILSSYDSLTSSEGRLKEKLSTVVDTLKRWDYKATVESKAMTIMRTWYLLIANQYLAPQLRGKPSMMYGQFQTKELPVSGLIAVQTLEKAVDSLVKEYGTPFISWGDINRLQRIPSAGKPEMFDDAKTSLPVGAAPGLMGSLFAFNTANAQTKKRYGVSGNTYVAIIEFGERIKAKSIMYFGQSADPTSPHYFDQAPLYAKGQFKDAWFYKDDVLKHAEKKYHPGE